jgi:hypothetical protein
LVAVVDEAKFRQQEEVIALLKSNIEAARSRYEIAKHDYIIAKQLNDDLGGEHADGAHSIRQALAVEHDALQVYITAVMKFTGLILDWKLPDDAT